MANESRGLRTQGRVWLAEPFTTLLFSGRVAYTVGGSVIGEMRRGLGGQTSSAHIPLPEPLASSPTDRGEGRGRGGEEQG